MSSDCKVHIFGIRGQSEDDIVLFFESERFCPKGGTVSHFVQISENEAVVIFEDSQVANRLDRHLILLDGTKISVEPHREYLRRTSAQISASITCQVTAAESDSSSINQRGINRSSSVETSRNGNHKSRDHQNSSGSSETSNKWSGKSKSNTHLNETPCSSTYDDSQSKGQGRFSRIDSCDSYKSEGSLSRESSRSRSRSGSRSSSSGDRKRTDNQSCESKTHDKYDGRRRKSGNGSKEQCRVDSKSLGAKTGGKHSKRKKSRSRSGNRAHTHMSGSKHRGGSPPSSSSSSSDGSDERQTSETRHETSKASTDRCNKSPSDATSLEHNKMPKSKKPPPPPPKPPKPPVAQKPKPEITRSVETLQFPCEKLKLMKLVWDLDSTLGSQCNCKVSFNEQTNTVIIEGEADDISTTKLTLYEMANIFETQKIGITPQIQKLLSTAKGESWLTGDFRQLSVAALVYIKDDAANLIARDKETLLTADNLLKQFVSTQNISFTDGNLCFLKSPSWSQKVQAIEASGLVSVHANFSTKNVELAGRTSDVDSYAAEIQELLKKNNTKTNVIKLTIGVVRMLKKQEGSISRDIHEGASSSIQLEFRHQDGIVKVSGLLDDVHKAEEIIRNKYIKAICYDKHEVCTPGLTKEMFREKNGKQRDMIELLEGRHNCVIEVRGGGQRPSSSGISPQKAESPSETPSTGIEISLGDIVQFKADVLVNTIADEKLEWGGVVLKQFLDAGAPTLKQELQKLGIPKTFGSDVVATKAYGKLKSKFIFHAAIRKYQNEGSIEKLHNMIKKCLEMATQQKASSIAFPALGSGRLAFTPKDVIECFVQAKQTTQTTIKIFIVAVDPKIQREFKSHLSNALSGTDESGWSNDSDDDGQKQSSSDAKPSPPVRNVIVLHINTTNKRDLQLVKDDLVKKLDDMVDEFVIKNDVLTRLDDDTVAELRALQTSEVAIDIDRRTGVIKVKGDMKKVYELSALLSALVFSLDGMDHYPKYWTNFHVTDDAGSKVGKKRVKLNPASTWHAEVSQLVMASWDQSKVGLGRDAKGLGTHAIKIRNVYCIENPMLIEKYMAKRKHLAVEASLNKFSPVDGLRKEQEIVTMKLGLRHLYSTLDKTVNEVFLLHGTKKERIDLIDTDGLDTRICANETLFGCGSYCAESSTKADQYADSVTSRVGLGQPLYMYVCRVLLGKPYVCDDPKNVKDFKRPPCTQANCHKDRCAHAVGRFDSVIGTHRPNPQVSGRLHFREFVVFHPEQSYPDFLVEYERVKHP